MRLDRQLVRWIHGDSISLTVPYYIPCFQEPSTWENPVLGTCVDPPMVFDRTTDELGWVTARDPWLANVSHSCWYIHDIYIYIYIHTNFTFLFGAPEKAPLIAVLSLFEVGRCSKPCMDTQRKRSMLCSRFSMLFWAECGQGATTSQGPHPRHAEMRTHMVNHGNIYIYIILYIHTYTNIGVKTLVPWWTQKKLVSGCSSP